jgi:serine/threonine protein phosphatase PrpC
VNFLQRLFSQPKTNFMNHNDASQHELESVENAPLAHNQPPNSLIGLDHLGPGLHVGKLSDVGQERERNEDSLYALDAIVQHDLGQETFGLFIVADGMGGHQKGELASALAVRVSANAILKDVYLPYLANDQNVDSPPLNEVLIAAVQHANTLVQKLVPGAGTTLTIALTMGNTAYIAHVGDTRAYLFKANKLKRITEDHSLAQKLQDAGQATAEEAAQVQNVLYKAIGQSDLIGNDIDIHVQPLPPGASLILCSDGLWGLVDEERLTEVLISASTPQQACEQLVTMANDNGGRDNISVIIISMGIENQMSS